MKTVVVGSHNAGKVAELRALLAGVNVRVETMDAYPDVPEVVEDGSTLEENAVKKARGAHEATGLAAIADDSGLEVFGLGMQPGVYSARYAGERVSYADNNAKLLVAMAQLPRELRGARFRCVLAYVERDVVRTFEGICPGTIAEAVTGTHGFGYDPLFIPDGFTQTFAELSVEVKNSLSHRARAFSLLKTFLLNRYGPKV